MAPSDICAVCGHERSEHFRVWDRGIREYRNCDGRYESTLFNRCECKGFVPGGKVAVRRGDDDDDGPFGGILMTEED